LSWSLAIRFWQGGFEFLEDLGDVAPFICFFCKSFEIEMEMDGWLLSLLFSYQFAVDCWR
jgi:hypothetical protein